MCGSKCPLSARRGSGETVPALEPREELLAGQLLFYPCTHTHITCFNFTQICHNFLLSEVRMFPLLEQLCWLCQSGFHLPLKLLKENRARCQVLLLDVMVLLGFRGGGGI